MKGVLRTRAPASLPQKLCIKLQTYYLGRYLRVVFSLLILKSLSFSFPGTLNPIAHVMPDLEDLRALWLTPAPALPSLSSPSRDGPLVQLLVIGLLCPTSFPISLAQLLQA